MKESDVQQYIQLEGPKYNCLLERNNSGAFTSQDGRHVRFGLGNISKKHQDEMASSDLIGITTIVITPAMVGRAVGIFTAIECKSPDWKPVSSDKRHRAQNNWINWVKSRGGISGFARSVEEFKQILGVR